METYLFKKPREMTGPLPTTETRYMLTSGEGNRTPIPAYYLITITGAVKTAISDEFNLALDVLVGTQDGGFYGSINYPYLYHEFKVVPGGTHFFSVQGIDKMPGVAHELYLAATCSVPDVSLLDDTFAVIFQKVHPYPL